VVATIFVAVVDTHVVDDMAGHMDALGVVMGKGDETGARGVSSGGLGGIASCTGHRWGSWGWQSRFVE
jgi:hypothetical protein